MIYPMLHVYRGEEQVDSLFEKELFEGKTIEYAGAARTVLFSKDIGFYLEVDVAEPIAKTYEVSLTTSATVIMYKEIRATSPEQAKEHFVNLLKNWESVNENSQPDISIIEPPVIGHDFQESDVEIICPEDL